MVNIKSTFINALTGAQQIDSGKIEAGDTVVFGTYNQMGIPFLDPSQSVLDFVKERVESSSGKSMAEAPQEAMKLLKTFQFPRQRWSERVSMLSGGERRRLQLLAVLTKVCLFFNGKVPSLQIMQIAHIMLLSLQTPASKLSNSG